MTSLACAATAVPRHLAGPPAWRRLHRAAAGLAFVAAFGAVPAAAAEYVARNAAEVAAAASRARPGDVVLMEGSQWRDQVIEFTGEGAPGKPIVLKPRVPGSIKLDGSSRIEISGRWLQAEGLRFEGGALDAGKPIVQFRGKRGEASNSRLTDSAFIRYNPPDPKTRYPWVALYGQDNRVDHNRFEGMAHEGVTVAVFRKAKKIDGHQIDHNYFLDRPRGDGNGFETIRVGAGATAYSDSNTRIERNLFERTDGEVETVSIKSGGNVIRENTFREVAGTITLRRGSGNTVENNIFIGNGKAGTGGIRVTGNDHIVRGNVIQGVEGLVGGAISISCGVDKPTDEVEYDPVRRLQLRGNVIVDSDAPAIKADALCNDKRNVRPSDVVVEDNVVVGKKSPVMAGQQGDRWSWKDNEVEGEGESGAALPPGTKRAARAVTRGSDGVARAALPRGGTPNVGNALTAADVGPSWWKK
ncbi:MAG: polysaccharide lyase 6 family protein [Piscinibacter sp.]|uniref:polysaccharide lyase 6 family protein n=1 Tax=Piscinibacter sp. TaxID=1903157 RepID=UPI00258C5C2C|nr:polysaccharide lyase 6 family protein [Piscinibacter sp.]MCW5666909.1 polysaccharide lyase 6 family protein [Piscinibacter sp.]